MTNDVRIQATELPK